MNAHVSVITLGVSDVPRARQFYGDGLGWPVQQAQGEWASFAVGDGSSVLALYSREALAADAGMAPDGSGFPGFTLSYVVRSDERVDEVLSEAERAGGQVVKPAEDAPWGGRSGYFADPEGHLWKVASGVGDQPYAE
jgi:uncharacterized protein